MYETPREHFQSSLLHFTLHVWAWPRDGVRRQWAVARALAHGVLRTRSTFSQRMKTDHVETRLFWPKDLRRWETVCPEWQQVPIPRPTQPAPQKEGHNITPVSSDSTSKFPPIPMMWRVNSPLSFDLVVKLISPRWGSTWVQILDLEQILWNFQQVA